MADDVLKVGASYLCQGVKMTMMMMHNVCGKLLVKKIFQFGAFSVRVLVY